MHYYLPTRILHIIIKSSLISLAVALFAALVGCDNEPDESTETITKEIKLYIVGTIDANDTSVVSVELYQVRGNGSERLRLGDGDRLTLAVDDVVQELREERITYNDVITNRDVYYKYIADYFDNISSKNIKLRFDRVSQISAPNTSIVFGTSPSIVTPSSSDTFSITSDDIIFEWLADTISGGTIVVRRTHCDEIESLYNYEFIGNNDETTFTFTAKPTAQLACDNPTANLSVTRSHGKLGALDPALYQEGHISTSMRQSVRVGLTE